MTIKSKTLMLILISLIFSSALSLTLISSNYQNKVSSNNCCNPNVTTFGGTLIDRGVAVGVDSQENIIIAGYSESFGGYNVYVVKFDSYLNQLWNASWPINKFDSPCDLVIDSSDNIYVAGTIWEEIAPGNFSKNIFILKFDSDGNILWDRTWQTSTHEEAYCIALDAIEEVYVAGSTTASSGTVFILKYSSAGAYQWNVSYGENEHATAYDMQVNNLGEIFITGSTDKPYPDELLLAKFDATGSPLWNQTLGGLGTKDVGQGIALSGTDIYVVGQTESLATHLIDTILIKYDSNGQAQWNQTWDAEFGQGIVIRPDGNIAIAGYFVSNSIFAVEYSPTGMVRWNSTWNGGGVDYGWDICAATNSLYIVGETTSIGSGDYDMLLLAYNDITTVTVPLPTTITLPPTTTYPPGYQDVNKIAISFGGQPWFWILFILLIILILCLIILLVLILIDKFDVIVTDRRGRRTWVTRRPRKKVKKKEPTPPEKPPEGEPLTLESDIDDAPEVGPATAKQLRKIGITKVKDFMAKSPEEIVELLEKRGYKRLSVEDITRMQTETQMMLDVPRLRVHDAVILHKVGVRSRSALTKQKPDDLWKRVLEAVKDQHVKRFLRWKNLEPYYEEMTEWIDGAKAATKAARAAKTK